jgi:hypothetical protein
MKEFKHIWINKSKIKQSFGKKEKESRKDNPGKERIKYEIGQRTTTMKTTNKKFKQCSNKHQNKIVKLLYL